MEPPVVSSDADLATLACGGDRRAFDELVIRHKMRLFRLARGYVGNNDDAYDVVQEAFVAAWLALPRYKPTKEFLPWLRTITLNKCRDFARRRAVRWRILRIFASEEARPLFSREWDIDAEQEADEAKLARLDQAIAGLPSFYKEPLLLVSIQGLSHKAAADQLNTTAKAIEMRLRRAKQKLAVELSDLIQEG